MSQLPPENDNKNEDSETAHSTSMTVDPPVIPLEWTKLGNETSYTNFRAIQYPSDVFDISSDIEETYLEIIGTAGQKITNMGKDLHRVCSPNLTHLIFRSHLITKMEGFSSLQKLQLLELYDNSIESLDGLDPDKDSCCFGDTLTTLDMSYNVIRVMNPVEFCPNLVELYIANNKLKTISGLKHLSSLRKIDLGANRIRKMEESELSGLVSLEELWLGKNKIEKIEGISNLTKLRRLDVQSNRLTTVDNLTTQAETLEELYLAHNGIDDGGAMQETGLSLNFKELTTLDLTRNRLKSCKPFEHMTTLTALWISGNEIASFEDVDPLVGLGTRDGACLEEIYLEHNPIDQDTDYRTKLTEMIPSLNQIDANTIGNGYGHVISAVDTRSVSTEQVRQWQDTAIAKAKAQNERKAEAKDVVTP